MNVQYLCECKYMICTPTFKCFRVWTGFCPRFEFMFLCMYSMYVCMYAGMFLCTQICANFLHIFNSVLHTHKYIQTQCVCISLLDIHRSRYASKKDAICNKSRNESAIQYFKPFNKLMLTTSLFRAAKRADLHKQC